MDWEPFVALATLIGFIVTLIWGGGVWRRREKAKIEVTNVSYAVDRVDRQMRVYLGIEFRRSGGNDIRYVRQILLKPDQGIYGQLRQRFELPSDGIIKIATRIQLQRDKFTSSYNMWEPPTYKALPNIRNAEGWDKATQLATQLSQKSYRIGLVWEDNGKITWKAISTRTSARWV